MAKTLNFYESGFTEKRKAGSWVFKILLLLSFIWISIYPVVSSNSSFGLFSSATQIYDTQTFFRNEVGNFLNTSSVAFSMLITNVLVEALISWLLFEFIFFIYRWFLTSKIYSFVIPKNVLKNESRMFFSIKNLIFGVLVNLSFWFPYLYEYAECFNIVLVVALLLVFAVKIQKNYSEPLIAHFVFKTYCYPVIAYECIVLLFAVFGVLL